MRREIDMKEISDGRLYGLNDMVKAACGSCEGCSACCQGMGSSVLLDPLDIYRLASNLKCTFEELLAEHIELNVFDGVILPDLKMAGPNERCSFLNQEGRCSIHRFRPGICRIFPLGRYYENGGFRYFLQKNECKHENRSKVKVQKWIDTPNRAENEQFIVDWHYYVKALQNIVMHTQDEALKKDLNLYLLNRFYREPYCVEDVFQEKAFYPQFRKRLEAARKYINVIGVIE